jgi:Polyketide cyclase / dehydrase and lipid transport
MAGTIEKSLLAVAILGILLPHAGWAHGPSRQKITEIIQIDAPPAKVWETIADFHDMSWLPGVAKTTGEGGNDPDAVKRQLTLDGGATIDESLGDQYRDARGDRENARRRRPPRLRNVFARSAVNFSEPVISDLMCVAIGTESPHRLQTSSRQDPSIGLAYPSCHNWCW